LEPVVGVEPTTCCLRNSATGLYTRIRHKRDRRFGLSDAFLDMLDLSIPNIF